MPSIVFVSAFLDLGEDRSKDKSVETCFQHFSALAKTGAKIHLYLSHCYQKQYETICKNPPNVLVDYIELSQLETYREIQDLYPHLPEVRTPHHDTRAFMTLMNAKAELVARAMGFEPGSCASSQNYGWTAKHFAWIDFSIFHVFRQPYETAEYITILSRTRFSDSCMLVPGCWGQGMNRYSLFEKVNWRFCGGFFLGSASRILELNTLYRTHWRNIVAEKGLTWEVNMMAHFEQEGWKPEWFHADHNDTIVRVPPHSIPVVASLTTIPSRVENCLAAIDSLLPQVDHVYLSVCSTYKRFDQAWETPPELTKEPYASKVTVVVSEDYGPATKYIGAATQIPPHSWTFVCDDDQIYHPTLISRMRNNLESYGIYQNHYEAIRQKTSGGLIHGYVGLLVNSAELLGLKRFPLPDVARFVDDQWMSIYCFKQGLTIRPSKIENYRDIFAKLDSWHELIGPDSLAGLNNRADMVRAMEEIFGVKFNGANITQ